MSYRKMLTEQTVQAMKANNHESNDLGAIRFISNTIMDNMIRSNMMSKAQANQLSQKVTIREVQKAMRKMEKTRTSSVPKIKVKPISNKNKLEQLKKQAYHDHHEEVSSDSNLYVSKLHEKMAKLKMIYVMELPEEPEYSDDIDDDTYNEMYEYWELERDEIIANTQDAVSDLIDEYVKKIA